MKRNIQQPTIDGVWYDGGNADEPLPAGDPSAPEKVTVELPRFVKVGYTDPQTGRKTTRELDMKTTTPAQVTELMSKGWRMERKAGDINREIDAKVRAIVGSGRGDAVTKEKVKGILEELRGAQDQELDPDLEEGDFSKVGKALKARDARIAKLEEMLTDFVEGQKEAVRRQGDYELEIKDALEAYPNLTEKDLVDSIKRLKTPPEQVAELADILSTLAAANVDVEKLPPAKRKEVYEKMQEELKDQAPPPPEGEAAEGGKKDEDGDDYYTAEGMKRKALKLLKERRGNK